MNNETLPRIIVRIELTRPAKQALEQACEASGMTQVALLSRVTEWFAAQDRTIQAMVLGHYEPAVQKEVCKLLLKKLGA